MTAHRYWRLFFPDPSDAGSFSGVQEFEFHATAGGADFTTPSDAITKATASAFQLAGTEGYQAFDDIIVSGGGPYRFWQMSGDGRNAWIKYDCGAGTEKELVEVRMYPLDSISRTFKQALVQWSDDDSAWTTDWFFCIEWASQAWQLFTKPTFAGTTSSYWCVAVLDSQLTYGAGGQIAGSASEVEFRTAAGGSNQATGGTAISFRPFDGSSLPANAFDSNTATAWNALDTGFAWLGYHFASPITLAEVFWRTNGGSFYGQAPKNGWIARSTDGISWAVVCSYGPLTWSGSLTTNTITVTIPSPPSTRRRGGQTVC